MPLRSQLGGEANINMHNFPSFSKKALDLEAKIGHGQTPITDGRRKSLPPNWKAKGRIMFVDNDGSTIKLDDDFQSGVGSKADSVEASGSGVIVAVAQKVTTDASQYGIGVVLAQQEGKKLRPVEYMSKKMPSQKLAKSTYEKELYEIYKALTHCRHYLLGRFFYVRTDHPTLRWMKTQPVLSDALKRWIEVIEQYDFEPQYIKGEYNKVADALSRRPDFLSALVTEFGLVDNVTQSLVDAYREDPFMTEIIRRLEAKDKKTSAEFELVNGLLSLEKAGNKRLCVPNRESYAVEHMHKAQAAMIESENKHRRPSTFQRPPKESLPGGWWNEITHRFPWLGECTWPAKPTQELMTCVMDAIKLAWDIGRLPHFFEMLDFSDLAVLAGASDRGRDEFDDELRVLCEKLELEKQEYARECRELEAQDPNSSINAPGQMITLPSGGRSWKRQKSKCDGFFHVRYTSRVMECLSIRRLVNEALGRVIGDETVTWLERTRIGWTYNSRIASRLCRPAEVFCEFDVTQWMESYDPDQCPCRSRRYLDMRSNSSIELLHSEGYKHVITLDSPITNNLLLQGIINSSLNHIPCTALDVDEAVNGLGDFLDRLLALVMELRELTASTQSFLRRIVLKKGREKMTKYREAHRHVAAEPFEHPTVKREMEFLVSRFLICPTDKAPSTPAFVCKNFIRKLVFQRLFVPEFASIAAPAASVISRIRGGLPAMHALPIAPAALSYLMTVFKVHKGTFRWITNTANTIISPAVELCACLLHFLLLLVQTFYQERSLEAEEQQGVRPNMWWAIASVGEFCENLPTEACSVFTGDITKCFETIPTDNSEDSLPTTVRFHVQSAMRVRRERSSSHAIRIKVGANGSFWPTWTDADQPD
ncbi:hypothetical protein CBR_g23433 [Chara braunii]|uniref:Reverse transcriptase RNase H-like domain-containing protein n=1 Tax=Chara braunii TaxID=69332 RepID=A0A388L4D9_CHABU|nr:hypothetical protein CBR_g23433 [Chara braunii]|eukprot:GBG77108.1 hypothetical protein CBR_g23433 [Chara braunii]